MMESFNILLSDLPDREQTAKLLQLKDKVDRIMSKSGKSSQPLTTAMGRKMGSDRSFQPPPLA
jgi:hypothetical protein